MAKAKKPKVEKSQADVREDILRQLRKETLRENARRCSFREAVDNGYQVLTDNFAHAGRDPIHFPDKITKITSRKRKNTDEF